MPEFQTSLDRRARRAQLKAVFERIGLTREMFEAAPFTRLKELKHLRDTGQIDDAAALEGARGRLTGSCGARQRLSRSGGPRRSRCAAGSARLAPRRLPAAGEAGSGRSPLPRVPCEVECLFPHLRLLPRSDEPAEGRHAL